MKLFKGLAACVFMLSFALFAQASTINPGVFNQTGTGSPVYSASPTLTGTISAANLTASGAIVDTAGTTDINPAFSAALLGNPIVKELAGTATVAQINAGVTILTGVSTRKIYVLGYDFVATGTPITCTGVLLEDTTGTPVVAASVPVASLTSGTHDLTTAAQLGAGFGQAGLTASQSLQLKVNGSNCATMTSMSYSIQYTVQ